MRKAALVLIPILLFAVSGPSSGSSASSGPPETRVFSAMRGTPAFFAALTVFPDAGKPGTTSVDGDVGTNSNVTWTGARTVADCVDCSGSSTITTESSVNNGGGPSLFSVIRALMNFDTSSLGAGATVTSATLTVTPSTSHFDFATGDFVRLVANTIVSHTDYATTDYALIGSTTMATGDASIASMVTNGPVVFTLSAAGLANISKTGISHFGMRTGHDINNTTPVIGTDPTFPNSGGALVFFNSADSGTSPDRRPQLAVTFTPGGGKKREVVIGN